MTKEENEKEEVADLTHTPLPRSNLCTVLRQGARARGKGTWR